MKLVGGGGLGLSASSNPSCRGRASSRAWFNLRWISKLEAKAQTEVEERRAAEERKRKELLARAERQLELVAHGPLGETSQTDHPEDAFADDAQQPDDQQAEAADDQQADDQRAEAAAPQADDVSQCTSRSSSSASYVSSYTPSSSDAAEVVLTKPAPARRLRRMVKKEDEDSDCCLQAWQSVKRPRRS